jgi:hypothetical protein
VGVSVHVLQVGLVQVLMRVLGPVFVGVGMLVVDMVVLMRGVRVCMGHTVMVVLMRVRRVVVVLFGHGVISLLRNMLWWLIFQWEPPRDRMLGDAYWSVTALSPLSPRW